MAQLGSGPDLRALPLRWFFAIKGPPAVPGRASLPGGARGFSDWGQCEDMLVPVVAQQRGTDRLGGGHVTGGRQQVGIALGFEKGQECARLVSAML